MILHFKQSGACAPIPNNIIKLPDSKVYEANMGPTWVLWAPGGPDVGSMNLAIWAIAFSTFAKDSV